MHRIAFTLFAALLFIAMPAFAESRGTKDEAVAMVQRAQEMFKKEGADAIFKAVDDSSNKDFHDRDLYVFIFTLSGDCVAHGARPAMIGKNFEDLKDQDGTYILRNIISIVKGPGSGWTNFKFPNPITKQIEDKSAYVEKMGDNYFVGVGVYSGK